MYSCVESVHSFLLDKTVCDIKMTLPLLSYIIEFIINFWMLFSVADVKRTLYRRHVEVVHKKETQAMSGVKRHLENVFMDQNESAFSI